MTLCSPVAIVKDAVESIYSFHQACNKATVPEFPSKAVEYGLLKTRLLLPTSELVPRQWACGLCHVYVGTRRYCSPAETCASLLQCCLERMWPLVESSDVLLL